jgi:polyhydroxyalkanoate synthase subunit PhaE
LKLGIISFVQRKTTPGNKGEKIMEQQAGQHQEKEANDMTKMFDWWLKAAMEFWGNMPRMQPDDNAKFDFFSKQQDSSYQAQQTWDQGAKIAGSLASMFSEPENLEALFKKTDTLQEFIMKMSKQVWEGYLEVQKNWADQATKMSKYEKAYNLNELDQETFKALREIYEKEFQRFFYIPQIGLTRSYQERANMAMDKYTLFKTSLSEFIYMFYVPLEQSMSSMQEKIKGMVEKGETGDNYKECYSLWIKTLEAHYMKLLQTAEYTEVMNKTIQSLVAYRRARDEIMYDILKNLPIPTNRDMDEFYKEFYELKKKVRELSRKMEEEKKQE